MKTLGLATKVKHLALGTLSMQNLPVTLSRTSGAVHSHSPAAGEHTGEILKSLGYSATEMQQLRDKRVI